MMRTPHRRSCTSTGCWHPRRASTHHPALPACPTRSALSGAAAPSHGTAGARRVGQAPCGAAWVRWLPRALRRPRPRRRQTCPPAPAWRAAAAGGRAHAPACTGQWIDCPDMTATCRRSSQASSTQPRAWRAARLTATRVTPPRVARHSAGMLQAEASARSLCSSAESGASRRLSSGVVSMAGSADRLTSSAPGACYACHAPLRTCARIRAGPQAMSPCAQPATCLCPCACACPCTHAAVARLCQVRRDCQPGDGDCVAWPTREQGTASGGACGSADPVHSPRCILQASSASHGCMQAGCWGRLDMPSGIRAYLHVQLQSVLLQLHGCQAPSEGCASLPRRQQHNTYCISAT